MDLVQDFTLIDAVAIMLLYAVCAVWIAIKTKE